MLYSQSNTETWEFLTFENCLDKHLFFLNLPQNISEQKKKKERHSNSWKNKWFHVCATAVKLPKG